MLLPLLAELRITRKAGRPRTRPDAVCGDKAYLAARPALICENAGSPP